MAASPEVLSYRVLGAEALAGREVLQHELTIFLYPSGGPRAFIMLATSGVGGRGTSSDSQGSRV
jgi:hypothetical protein